MSLKTDLFFARSCRRLSIMETTEGRVFNTGRDEISEEEDKIPYIVTHGVSYFIGKLSEVRACVGNNEDAYGIIVVVAFDF